MNSTNMMRKTLDSLISYVSRLGMVQRLDCSLEMLKYSIDKKEPAESYLWGGEMFRVDKIEELSKVSLKEYNKKDIVGNQKGHVMVYMRQFNGNLNDGFWDYAHEKIGILLGECLMETSLIKNKENIFGMIPDVALDKLYNKYKK